MEQVRYSSFIELIPSILARVRASSSSAHDGKFTYIIGNNGTGKSRALGEIARQLGDKRDRNVVACIASSIHDRFRYGDSGNVRYLGARNARNAVFLTGIERSLSRYILQAMRLDRRLFKALLDATAMDVSFSISNKSILELTQKDDELRRDGQRVQQKAASQGLLTPRSLGMLKRVASSNGRFEKLTPAQIPVLLGYLESNIDINLIIKVRDGEETSFGGLSTGEQNRLLLFAKVISVMEEGTVFLIDEPELSLHLHWQMGFHSTLKQLLSRLEKFHVVVATHSPILISEAVREDDNSEDVVTVLTHGAPPRGQSNAGPIPDGDVYFRTYSFTDVASHEQLVLKQFQTSTYETKEVSFEIADTILNHIEGRADGEVTLAILQELRGTVGLSEQAKQQIQSAIRLVEKGVASSFANKVAK